MYLFNRGILLIGLIVFVQGELFAQNYLILQKGANQKSRIIYEVGDEIIYLQKGNDYYIKDIIREIDKEYIALSENVLSLKQIEALDIRYKDERNQTLANLTYLPFAGGGLLLLAGGINSLADDGNLQYSSGVLATAAALIGTGFIMKSIRYKKFKVGGKRKIMVIRKTELE
ncbi:hypothetical protein [Cyclobacterium marinum]|uniref:Uncharacterized protein n=1 Tax=Cyclobacterium marinum (strain ATCC 25205 / DSM 745 / LMG 13164 / NCIMB 1802) TaxID=880070 RepID=G0IUK7_CYCMS|nr:hypothetical protein [Cyclobacterium marinum]AEL24770.1 hypothetical protein Cycma_0998 [Cyclobacterium marinum DSM 745]MBR9776775.1 hypothetical protein [Cytophagales bacterium]|tara:strand:- start:129001 stop:129516 length:516 start_codon:yes stop_codon:yes gene_type:complete